MMMSLQNLRAHLGGHPKWANAVRDLPLAGILALSPLDLESCSEEQQNEILVWLGTDFLAPPPIIAAFLEAARAYDPEQPQEASRRSPVHGISTAGATDEPRARTTALYHSKPHFELALKWIEDNYPGGKQLVARALFETGHT